MAKHEYYYGIHSVETLLELEPERVLTLFTLKERDNARLKRILQLAEPFGISIQQTSRDRLDKMAGLPYHQGLVAVVRALPTLREKDLDQLLSEKPDALLLVLDQITDPHNLGACIRTAAAMGIHAVIVPRDKSASLTPTARKISAGGAEKVKFIQVNNLAKTLAHIKENFAYKVVGTFIDEQAIEIQKANLTGKIVIIVGAEDTGIRPIIQAQCDEKVFIPMSGALQSLNVSVATGMTLYEMFRQRHLQ